MKNNTLSRSNTTFLNPYVCVDIVLFMVHEGVLKVLLINRDAEPFKSIWALPGGFPRKHETTRDTAMRVLKEKVGLSDTIFLEQLYTFDTQGRDPRGPVFSVSYIALIPYETYEHINMTQSQQATLYAVDALPKLGFDHKDIITTAVARLRAKLSYTNIAYAALPALFTYTMLQKIYEIILGKTMDKRNFRKKIEQLRIITPTKKKLTGMKQRPAVLYKFVNTKLIETKELF